jgi:uncharacterized protein (TIGR03437 family)
VFKLNPTGVLTLAAGNARLGYSGDGGPAANAQLNSPQGLTVDAAGNLYVAEDNRVRMVSPTGRIITVAGNGSKGYSGDGGPATSAQISTVFWPPYVNSTGLAVDVGGSLYIADSGNNRVRKVSPAGVITTVAGTGTQGYSGDGGLATNAQFSEPTGVAVDTNGNLYIADLGNSRIRKVSPTGIVTTVAGNGSAGRAGGDGGPAINAEIGFPSSVAVDANGNIYIGDPANNYIWKVSAAGIIRTIAGGGRAAGLGDGADATNSNLSLPLGVAVDSSGNLYIADWGHRRIRKVTAAGVITTVAGGGDLGLPANGGPAESTQLGYPEGVALDTAGNLYVADSVGNRVHKVSPGGMVTTVAGNGSAGYSGDNGPAISARLNEPDAVAVDSSGNLYIADSSNGRVRKVSAAGIISTVAGTSATGYSGDGGPATDAQLSRPRGVAVDVNGNLFIADSGNWRIRKVSPTGIITTIAGNGSPGYLGDGGPAVEAQLYDPHGVAVDGIANIYIADSGNNLIRKVSTTGIITTVAGNPSTYYSEDGGPANGTRLKDPVAVPVDTGGNLYISEYFNSRVRRVSTAGIMSTVVGTGAQGYSGDGRPATSAQIGIPGGMAIDASGKLYLADPANGAIRLLTPITSICSGSVSSAALRAPAAGGTLVLTITADSTCGWTISTPPEWVTIASARSGSGTAGISLVVAPNSGAPRSTQILIAGNVVNVAQSSNVFMISNGGAVDDAYAEPAVPGSIVSIFGNFLLPDPIPADSIPLPIGLGGLSLRFEGGPSAPLFYADAGQVNGQVPWELAGRLNTTITATLDGRSTAPQLLNLAKYAPGIFTTNGGGAGQGAILDGNYRLVDPSNPAVAGSTVVQIYCTGLGPVTNQPATGSPSPNNPLSRTTSPPSVVIGGALANVVFSGLAPGAVGLYQVNALVPSAAAKGSAVPAVISIGGLQSNTVTVAVK